jgi:hypothetical protein
MSFRRNFVFQAATGAPSPLRLNVLLSTAAAAIAVILFGVGLAMMLAFIVAVTLAFLPVRIWSLLTANRRPAEPATIDGEYTITTLPAVERRHSAPDRRSCRR